MLSENQTKVLDCVAASIRSDGIAPSLREIAAETALSFPGGSAILMQLESKGYIKRRFHKPRCISVFAGPMKRNPPRN